MFNSTGAVLCVSCRAHMRLVSMIPDHQGAYAIEFGCAKCSRVRKFNIGRVECQGVELQAA